MKLKHSWIALLVVAGSLTLSAQQPVLTLKQQIELATARQVEAIEYDKLTKLPGYKEQAAKVSTAQQKLLSLQESYCQSRDGKKYHLENTAGVWSCQVTK